MIGALIVAAGQGKRFGTSLPKQFSMDKGRSLLSKTIECFLHHPLIDRVHIVLPRDFLKEDSLPIDLGDLFKNASNLSVGEGGDFRFLSVQRGIEALKNQGLTYVLIHDGVRPYVSDAIITRVIEGLKDHKAVIPIIPSRDTLKKVCLNTNIIKKTIDRSDVYGAQTPQGFCFKTLEDLYARYSQEGALPTDEASLCEFFKILVYCVRGEISNMKITYAEDRLRDTRVGHGFDVHAFCEGASLVLGGVVIDAGFSLKGHSDADVVIHSLVDALLGGIAEEDIGEHFSDRDPKWKGTDSKVFLDFALMRLKERGAFVVNVDITIMAEVPKIAPYRQRIRERLASYMELSIDRISVKATTTEGLGFCGRREGIAVTSLVMLSL